MKSALAVAAASLVLAGCAMPPPAAPRPADPSAACLVELGMRADLAPLKQRIAIGIPPSKASLEMFGDSTKPTPEQTALIGQYEASRKACFDSADSYRRAYLAPNIIQEQTRYSAELTRLIAPLYAGNVTFGQFNTQHAEAQERAVSKVRELLAANAAHLEELQDSIDNIGKKSYTTCRTRRGTTRCVTD